MSVPLPVLLGSAEWTLPTLLASIGVYRWSRMAIRMIAMRVIIVVTAEP
jgi:hypothetical protein